MRARTIYIATTLEDNPVSDHFSKLGEALAQRGHKVVLLTPHRKVELEDPYANPAIYTWPSDRPTRWRDARFLRGLLKSYPADSLIAHFAAVNMMCLVGWSRRVRCRIVWYHTMKAQLIMDNPAPVWKRAVFDLRKRLIYRMATHIVANSQASARDVQAGFGVPAHKCRIFYNSLADPLAADQKLAGVAPTPGKLVCVARLFPSKGLDVLLRALALLRQKAATLHLHLIGTGPWHSEYCALAQSLKVADRCTFWGRVPHANVFEHMRQAMLVVSPSRSEALGNVNIEALAVGTPVVGSAVDGIREIVRDGVEGFLVPPEDPPRLAEAIHRVTFDAGLRHRLALQARARFLSTFEQKRLVAEQILWQESLFQN